MHKDLKLKHLHKFEVLIVKIKNSRLNLNYIIFRCIHFNVLIWFKEFISKFKSYLSLIILIFYKHKQNKDNF